MASPTERRRNNIRAGVFVIFSILLAIAVIMVLSGAWDSLRRQTAPYTVVYTVDAGVSNVKPGAEVRVGGVVMGHVTHVRPDVAPGEPFQDIDVDFDIDRRVTLYEDARVYVTAPLLGADAWLDIVSVGTEAAGAPPQGVIRGREASGLLNTVLGEDGAEIISNTKDFSRYLADFPRRYGPRMDAVVDNVQAVTERARSLATRLDTEDWPRWAKRVDAVTEWAATFTATIDEAVENGDRILAESRAIVEENRQPLKDTFANAAKISEEIRAVSERARTETMGKIEHFLDGGSDALHGAQSVIERFGTDYDGWSVELGETLANTVLASQQLKLALTEVRRSPWKLTYRPTDEEMSHELLYDAARSFALAAADLRAASTSVATILDRHADRLELDPDQRRRLRVNFMERVDNYEHAQQRMLDILFDGQP